MPTEELFKSDSLYSQSQLIWAESDENRGSNPLSYIDPMYRQTITDFPPFTGFWALRDTYEVALYPIRAFATAKSFNIWNTYRVNQISTLYTTFDTRNLEQKQVSPQLQGGFYKVGTKLKQYYVIEEEGTTYLLRIDVEFRTISSLEFGDEFDVNTGREWKDFVINSIANIDLKGWAENNEEPDEDANIFQRAWSAVKDFVSDSEFNDIVGVWLPVNWSAQAVTISESDAISFSKESGTSGGKSQTQKTGVPLLPAGLIGYGLFTGALPVALAGAGLFLLGRTQQKDKTQKIDDIEDIATRVQFNPNQGKSVSEMVNKAVIK